MKNIFNKLLYVLAIGVFFLSCEENAIPELTVPVNEESTFVKFFFHAEDAPEANFYLDDKKITGVNTDEEEVEGLDFGGVYPTNAYALVPSGNFEMRAVDIDMNEVAFTQASFEQGENYSVYLVGTSENYEVAVLEDNLPADHPQNIYWRFVHTMANLPFEVDAYAVRAAVPETENSPAEEAQVIELGNSIGFTEGGEYQLLEPGRYDFKIFESGSEYDPVESTPFIQHSVTVGTRGRAYTTQIRGTYSEETTSGKIDFWRDR
ncbi:DUF4397 domain-containing protein [Salinimicrobium sp. GXAS 041]|uniref:DUF4397 domain-containing protein n=1 Tax=Salinimicrobium sp. GXAS 041 TaxID=3400806 RepID=UPI003C727E82